MRKELLIAKLFWKTTTNNRGIYLLALVVLFLFGYAAFTGWERYVKQTEIQQKYQHEARESWLSNPDKHPHRMAHYGHFAFRPKSPLSFFDGGMESFFGNAIFLEAHVQNTTNFSEAGFSTGMLRFGEISIAMILQIVLPLLIFFIGFATVAGERENGSLKVLLIQGISWKQLLIGKSLGIIAVVMVFYIPIMLICFLTWSVLPYTTITADDVLREIFIFIAYFLYLCIFCVATVLVSALSRSSKTSLSVLISSWLILMIVLPKASQSLGTLLYETPSKTKFALEVHEDIVKVGDSHNPDDPYYKAFKDSVLKANKTDSIQNLPFNYSGLVMKEGERITAEINNHHMRRLKDLFAKQNRFSKLIAFVDPYMGIKNLSMGLSNTDYASYADFQEQAEEYRYHLAQTMNDLQIKHITSKSIVSTEQPATIDKKYWASIDDFEYKPTNISTVFKNELISILSFLFWIVVLTVILIRSSKTLKAI